MAGGTYNKVSATAARNQIADNTISMLSFMGLAPPFSKYWIVCLSGSTAAVAEDCSMSEIENVGGRLPFGIRM